VEAKPLKQTEQVDERPIRPLQVAYQNQRDENEEFDSDNEGAYEYPDPTMFKEKLRRD